MTAQIIVRPWEEIDAASAGIWVIEIVHRGKLNAMTRSMWRQLRTAFEQLQSNQAVRCVVVQGDGSAFCAGGDISEYPAFRFDPAALAAFHEEDVWGGLNAMLSCDAPIIANINGACMGAGVEIASCCDIRFVAETAKFGAPIAKLGFPMAPKEMRLVASSVGGHVAKRMLLEAAVFSAKEMAATGWCAQPLPSNLLQEQVAHSVQRIASLAPQAARLNKQAMRSLASDGAVIAPYAYATSAEHREGVMAFLDKRPPNFLNAEI